MRAMVSSSSSSSAQQQQQGQEQAAPGELAVLAETLRLLFCRAFVDPVLNPPRIGVCVWVLENFMPWWVGSLVPTLPYLSTI